MVVGDNVGEIAVCSDCHQRKKIGLEVNYSGYVYALIELETQIVIMKVTKKESKTKDIVFLIDGPEQHCTRVYN
jgi:hypothetical protein